jgi:hypothetical protein
MATEKNPIVKKVSGKVVKKTTRNLLNPFAKPKVSIIVERTTRKPAPKANAAEKIAKRVKETMVDPTSVFSKSSKPTSKPKVKPVSPKTKPAMPKSKSPAVRTGDKAAEAMRKRTSPKGVKEYEKGAKKALEKKYPGLYKKSK